MIDTAPFGHTGHESSRLVFGAAALWDATQEEADSVLARVRAAGVNHIDVAASYGDAELRLAPWLVAHRNEVFLATKTGERSYDGAYAQIRKSLERMRVDCVDLIQLHNLVDPDEHERALGPGGALQAAVEAREEGLVRFIGVTGHGSRVARMHLASLERFAFDSVLLPYSRPMQAQPAYAEDFEALLALCEQRGVAVQTIKAVARRRWQEGAERTHGTWYEPLTDPDAIERAMHWALARPGIFVNSAGDRQLLDSILAAASSFGSAPDEALLTADAERLDIQPLFLPGFRAPA